MTLVSDYAPTMNATEDEKMYFYEMLKSVLLKVSQADKIVILGDFNARVSRDCQYWSGF